MTVRLRRGFGERGPPGQDLAPRALAEGVLEGVRPGVEPEVGASSSSHIRRAPRSRPTSRWLAAVRETALQVPALLRQHARTNLPVMARGMEAARRDSLEATLVRVAIPFTHGRLVSDIVRGFLGELDASTSAASA